MNKVTLIGRLVKDCDVRYTTGEDPICIAKFTLAVDRRVKKEGQPTADFIQCIGYRKMGEFAERNLHKGIKYAVSGAIQTGSYTNKDGIKVHTFDVVCDEIEFCEKKEKQEQTEKPVDESAAGAGFMGIPDNVEEGGLPFN